MYQYLTATFVIIFFAIPSAQATEYIYRDVMGNTLPSAQCNTESIAKQIASQETTISRYGKRFCQMQGYGWHLEKIKQTGTTACNACPGNNAQQKCKQDDLLVTCKRIKPGTVGMLPGKG